jgi:hypothetical protein
MVLTVDSRNRMPPAVGYRNRERTGQSTPQRSAKVIIQLVSLREQEAGAKTPISVPSMG